VNQQDPVVIVATARTAIGGFQGAFAAKSAPQLGAAAIKAALGRSGLAADEVSEVLMGCVLPAGQGQAPARQAALGAGLPDSVPCATLNKMCGSGMKTVMTAFDALHADPQAVFIAGGMESMTNAPYLLPKARGGLRLGHGAVLDHMFLDGLEDAYDKGRLMGTFAEDCAEHFQFTRADQDAFAIASLTRARKAAEEGSFSDEIVPIDVTTKSGVQSIVTDEQPQLADAAKIPKLKPAFRTDGTVTPANSSSISDGAAALVLMRASTAEKKGLTPLARIVGTASHAQAPGWFTTAPIGATRKLLEKTGWNLGNIGLFEVNEAFAVVTMAFMRELDVPHDKVNVHGGACALGHPIGASGARILVTLLAAMQRYDVARGLAAICIGGGEATAMALEKMN
jgi:acetyl-CoA C-acetyltransferase